MFSALPIEAQNRYQAGDGKLRVMTPAVWQHMVRLNRITDKLYMHIDMDVLDRREVMAHGNKVPNGPSSETNAAAVLAHQQSAAMNFSLP